MIETWRVYRFNEARAFVTKVTKKTVVWLGRDRVHMGKPRKTPRWYFEQHAEIEA